MADLEAIRQAVQSRAPFSTWLGVVILFVLFGVIVLGVMGPSPRGDDYEKGRAQKRIEKLKALQEVNEKQLSTYGWIDKNKGSVHLPIDRAMELTITELAAKKPAPAYPIAAPTPPAVANPSNAQPGKQPGASVTPAASPIRSGAPSPAPPKSS